jgi:hypothetical protein
MGVMVQCPTCGAMSARSPSQAHRVYCSKQCAGVRLLNSPERFWSHVETGAPRVCWPYQTAPQAHRYVRVKWHKTWDYAHRIAWRLTKGLIPRARWVLHSCDNPRCCNPNHLFLGTHIDNMADMVAKGRSTKGQPRLYRRGELHNLAKLTAPQVLQIRARYATGEITQLALAAEYQVGQNTISRIVRGHTWCHLLPPPGLDAPADFPA